MALAREAACRSPSMSATRAPLTRMRTLQANPRGPRRQRIRPSRRSGPGLLQVPGGRPAERVLRAHLDQHLQEGPRLRRPVPEPAFERVEDGQEGRAGRAAPAGCLLDRGGAGLEPGVQVGHDQVVLAAEVTVEGRLRHPRARGQLIDPDIPDAAPGEQVIRGVEETLPRAPRPGSQARPGRRSRRSGSAAASLSGNLAPDLHPRPFASAETVALLCPDDLDRDANTQHHCAGQSVEGGGPADSRSSLGTTRGGL